jgi:hypothetical protein
MKTWNVASARASADVSGLNDLRPDDLADLPAEAAGGSVLRPSSGGAFGRVMAAQARRAADQRFCEKEPRPLACRVPERGG